MKFVCPTLPPEALRAIRPLTALALAAFVQKAQATDYWWDSNSTTAGFGNTTGIWGTSAFWGTSNAGTATPTAAVTNSADGVNFGTATLNYANGTVGIAAGGVTVNSIVYGTAQNTPINLGTAGNILTLDGTTPTITVNHATASQTILSPIAGSTGLTKAGAGNLILSGSNTYTGATNVSAGTLSVNTLANAGSDSGIGNFATAGATGLSLSGGAFSYTGASTTTDRGFTATGASKKTISVGTGVNLTLGASVKNENTTSANGLTFIAGGAGSSITISSMTITAGSNPDFNISTNNPTVTIQSLNVGGSNVIAQRTGTALLNVGNINGTSASGWLSNMNVTGVISGYTGQLVLGNDVTLSGLSTFNTSIAVQQGGIYQFNSIKNWGVGASASALGAPTTLANGTIHFGNGAFIPTFRYIGTGDITNRVLNLRGSGTLNLEQAGAGHLHFTGNTTADTGNTGAKTLNLTGSTSGTGEFSGSIVEHTTTNKTSVSKSGTGKWTLSGANTYTGATTVNGGTLALGANNVLPNGSAISIGAATLDAATFTDSAGTLAVTAAATINLGSGAALKFADSSAVAWPGTLNITGSLLTSSIRFGTSGGGLTTTQLDKITVNGSGLGDYSLNSSGFLILDAGPPDTDPPTPSPMTWASVPAAAGSSSITMTATTATDASGVEYFFDETSGNPGGTDSGWQNSPSYTDTGLNANTSYSYSVTARDKSAAQNPTSASTPAATATTLAAATTIVWNVNIGNQVTTADNYAGAVPQSSPINWNSITSSGYAGLALQDTTGSTTAGVTLDLTSDRNPGGQALTSGDKIFVGWFGGAGASSSFTLRGLTITKTYDIVFYSDWYWKNGDSLPITQTEGTGLSGTFYLNRILSGTNGIVPALTPDTNPANVTSGAGNTGNYCRIVGIVPDATGKVSFRMGDGANTAFSGFQLVQTGNVSPQADMLSLSLASNPSSIRDAVFNGTNVTLTVPYGTSVTNLAPTYTLWPGATCLPASGTTGNFTTPQTYTVTSSDSLVTKTYTVTAVIAPPLPEFTLTAPSTWDGRSTITVQPNITNLALLQTTGGTNFTYQWNVSGVAVTQQITPGVLTLTRSQGSGPLNVTLTMANGTEGVTESTTINIQEPATDPWVERTPLANEKPVVGQFLARNPFTNLGTIYYRGSQGGTPDTVFLKVYKTPSGGSETLVATYTQALVGGAYDFTAPIEAGLFTYRVVYGTTIGVADTNVATVPDLVCGDAYIIEGQSNAQATDNSEPQVDTSDPWIKTYDASLGWGPAYAKPTSPNWGSKVGFWGMKLAQNIVSQHSMPVCIINGAVGGTLIHQHQANPANHTLGAGTYDIYANLLNRVSAARLNNGIRGIFWHQGESDCSNFGPILDYDYTVYERNFLSMSVAWKQDYPNFQRHIIYQVAPNPCGIGPAGDQLREVQRTIPGLYSKMSILNTLGLAGYEGCHFSKAGYENIANRMTPVVSRDFYGINPGSAVTAPNLKRAYFTSAARTAIALEFDQAMSWSSFSMPNYHINDLAANVTSGSASGNIVTLQLSSAAAANSTIDYLKDSIWNASESVSSLLYGANGIPALTFANVPIGAASPYQSWTSSKGLSGPAAAGDADPDQDGVENAIEFVLGGEPNPSAPGSNSSALLPVSTRNGAGDLVFTFRRKIASEGGVSLSFQWSDNLTFPLLNTVPIGATSSSHHGISVAISAYDAATDAITITVPAVNAMGGKLFGRLQAAAP